jgi:hypothetical protein
VKPAFAYVTFFALIAFVNCLSVSVAAQEIPGYEPGDSQYLQGSPEIDDKPLIYEPEGSAKIYRDTTSVTRIAPASKKPATSRSGVGTQNENDTFSFNFLYYIIHKFKSTDIFEP